MLETGQRNGSELTQKRTLRVAMAPRAGRGVGAWGGEQATQGRSGQAGWRDGERRTAAGMGVALRVLGRAAAGREAVTFWLARPGERVAAARYRPGQFITLMAQVDGETLYRSYSLCGGGDPLQPWEITVKRAGRVSNYLCDQVGPGDTLRASAPRGTFTLPESLDAEEAVIFIAAGSGVTPIMGMLRALEATAQTRRPYAQLHYAARSRAEMLYGDALVALDPEARWLDAWSYLSGQGRRLTVERVVARAEEALGYARARERAWWYICAPDAMKRELRAGLAQVGIAPERVKVEAFGSAMARAHSYSRPRWSGGMEAELGQSGAMATGKTTQKTAAGPAIRLAGSDEALAALAGETLLETLERHGYQPRFGCRAGVCGECAVRRLGGLVTCDDGDALSAEQRAAGYTLSCLAQPVGLVTLAAEAVEGSGARLERANRTAMGERAVEAQRGAMGWLRGLALRGLMVAATVGLFAGAWMATGQRTQVGFGATVGTQRSAPAIQHTPTQQERPRQPMRTTR